SAGPREGELPMGTRRLRGPDVVAVVPALAGWAGLRKTRYQTRPGALASTPIAIRATATRRRRRFGMGGVRSMPVALTTKLQLRLTTTAHPAASAATT